MSAQELDKAKRPKPYRTTKRFGILNPSGDMWTVNTFETSNAAQRHLEAFFGKPHIGLKKFKIIPVRVTVSALSCRDRTEG